MGGTTHKNFPFTDSRSTTKSLGPLKVKHRGGEYRYRGHDLGRVRPRLSYFSGRWRIDGPGSSLDVEKTRVTQPFFVGVSMFPTLYGRIDSLSRIVVEMRYLSSIIRNHLLIDILSFSFFLRTLPPSSFFLSLLLAFFLFSLKSRSVSLLCNTPDLYPFLTKFLVLSSENKRKRINIFRVIFVVSNTFLFISLRRLIESLYRCEDCM